MLYGRISLEGTVVEGELHEPDEPPPLLDPELLPELEPLLEPELDPLLEPELDPLLEPELEPLLEPELEPAPLLEPEPPELLPVSPLLLLQPDEPKVMPAEVNAKIEDEMRRARRYMGKRGSAAPWVSPGIRAHWDTFSR